jgi:ubiquinone/menaquinone biosynthesis C-methylase UbiE
MPDPNIDQLNTAFWEELCGSWLAKSLGITERTPDSLKRFDRAYLEFYPYLTGYIQPNQQTGKKVLEVGLGYGTAGQVLIDSGAKYWGVDIASGPVNMIKYRQALAGQSCSGSRASVLALPFSPNTFDCVISIGVFHHTGDVQRAIDETWRVLKPGGKAVLMLYNQYSYRQWFFWPLRTFKVWMKEYGRIQSIGTPEVTERQRKVYDASVGGKGAPETVFLSVRAVRQMMRDFRIIQITKENVSSHFHIPTRLVSKLLNRVFGIKVFKKPDQCYYLIDRKRFLSTVGRWAGLDLYITAEKIAS